MIIKRKIISSLLEWKNRPNRMPLLLRGARQVGKTSVVRTLGNTHYSSFVEINLEEQPRLISCFDNMDPEHIITTLSSFVGQQIIPGESLLFIDEIQEAPKAIQALRYFKEKMPQLDVIGAGSLLEFALNASDFRMPVGRVEFLYLYPLSFEEQLEARGQTLLLNSIRNSNLEKPLAEPLHERALELYREYLVLGGMPAVNAQFIETGSIQQAQHLQLNLLTTYRNDFAKYSKKIYLPVLNQLFDKIPDLIAQQTKYSKIDPELKSRTIKEAIHLLRQAGLLQQVYSSAATGLPLNALLNYKKYKLTFLDCGLVNSQSQLPGELLIQKDSFLINRGALAEQFVGQELIANTSPYTKAELYYWAREKKNSQAEVDYITQAGSQIVPIEVKAGASGRLKSLAIFMEEQRLPLGIQVSQKPLGIEGKVLSLPVYSLFNLDNLLEKI